MSMQQMMGVLARRPPQGGGIRFAQNVGTAPGSTTLCLGCMDGAKSPIGPTWGAQLADPCPPDEPNQYMLSRERSSVVHPAAPASLVSSALQIFDPYTDPVALKGAAPFGLSWKTIGLVAAGAAALGAGIGYYRSRR